MLTAVKLLFRRLKKFLVYARLRSKNNVLPLSIILCGGKIEMGQWNTIGKGFWSDGDVRMGSFCSVGPNVSFIGTRHTFKYNKGNHRFLKSKGIIDDIAYGKIEIGDNVFIGRNAIILHDIKIGDNCIIGAQAIVTKNMPDNSIVAGNPARIIGIRNIAIHL